MITTKHELMELRLSFLMDPAAQVRVFIADPLLTSPGMTVAEDRSSPRQFFSSVVFQLSSLQ